MLKNIFQINSKLNKNLVYNLTLPTSINFLIKKDFGAYRDNVAITKEYQKEKSQYKNLRKQMNKQHINDFWTEQTKVENDWLEDFFKIQSEKKRKDDAKLRNTIIKNSYAIYSSIQRELDIQKEFLAKQKLWREEEGQKLLEKHSVLNILDMQAEQDWLTPDNIDTRLSQQMNKILPPAILSHVDYYNRINKYSLLIETGQYEKAEELKLNKKIIEYKNNLLQPLYVELKMIISHLTYNEEHSVYSLYKETINRIENFIDFKDNKSNVIYLKDSLTFLFKRLISLIRLENEKANNKIEIIEKQMKALTMILVIWNKYVDIIYMPDFDVENFLENEKEMSEDMSNYKNPLKGRTLEDLVEDKDPKVLKEYYFSQVTDKKAKGSGLFLKDLKGLYDDRYIRKVVENKVDLNQIKVEKINEGECSSNSDVEDELNEMKEEEVSKTEPSSKADTKKSGTEDTNSENKNLNKMKKSGSKNRDVIDSEKRKLLENEISGIFEEFDLEEPTNRNVRNSTTFNEKIFFSEFKNSNKQHINADNKLGAKEVNIEKAREKLFNEQKKERKLLEEHMLQKIKKDVEQSKFSNLDVEHEYKKYKENLIKELGLKDQNDLYMDIEKEMDEVDLSKIIDINEYENEIKRENDRLTLENEFKDFQKEDLFSSNLFESMVKYSKDIFDFKNPKISTDLDIYDDNLLKFLEYSVKESNTVHRSSSSSVIMEFLKEELKRIDDSQLSPGNKIKKKCLMRLADVVGKMRITDSQNLKQVFNLYKHPNIKF